MDGILILSGIAIMIIVAAIIGSRFFTTDSEDDNYG